MSIWRIWKDEAGSALLEATVVVPMLIVLVAGTLEFSFFFFRQHLVSTGVRDAARYLARTEPAVGTAQTIAQNLAATGSVDGSLPLRVPGLTPGNVGISFSTVGNALDVSTGLRPYREASAACGGPDTIQIINVTGSYTYASVGLLGYLTSGVTLSVTHSERCIGPG